MIAKKLLKSTIKINRNFSSTTKFTKHVEGYIHKPKIDEINADYIGLPDKISNIRPVLRHIEKDETPLQRKLRFKQLETEEWVNQFWTRHNQNFQAEKKRFAEENKEITTDNDKWSEFYKNFLDKNWQNHFYFNIAWYAKNFELLFLSLRVEIQRGMRRLGSK